MRIGILTMVYQYNYGGILQCISLQNILRERGHQVDVIKYKQKYNPDFFHKIKQLLFDTSYQELKTRIIYFRKRQHINLAKDIDFSSLLKRNDEYIKTQINYTEECDEETIGVLIEKNEYDLIIIGSDKIWGGVGKKHLVYFGEWQPPFRNKVISYAACSSRDKIPLYNRKRVRNLLNRFNGVSTRDEHTKSLISKYCDKDIRIVCDPTLLFDNFESCSFKGPYILTYILGEEIKGGHKVIIEGIKKHIGNIPVYSIILPGHNNDIDKYSDKIIVDATPYEWIGLIKNASYIYTDSFHGTIFSLKYKKQFITYYKEKSRSSRLLDLKERYGLDNIISSANQFILNNNISASKYTKIHEIINQDKVSSLSFLDSYINS